MKTPLRFRIKSVDLYGFNGRENHPDTSDIGLLVTPVKMEAVHFDNGGHEEPVLGDDGRLLHAALPFVTGRFELPKDEDVLWFYTCVTEDGRLLDLISFELELANIEPEWTGTCPTCGTDSGR